MRTDKSEFVFHGTIDVASIKIWLRHPAKQDPADTTPVQLQLALDLYP
jgi:hypothetical protein